MLILKLILFKVIGVYKMEDKFSGIFVGVILIVIGSTLLFGQGLTMHELSNPTTATAQINETIPTVLTNATNIMAHTPITSVTQVLGNMSKVVPATQIVRTDTGIRYTGTTFNGSDINVSYVYQAPTITGSAGSMYGLVDFVWAGVGLIFVVIGGFTIALSVKKLNG